MAETATPAAGLSNLNTSLSAPRHKDLYRVAPDAEAAKADKRHQARVLGIGFFVVFGLIISGLSFTFNGAWASGRAAAWGTFPKEELPGFVVGEEGQAGPENAAAAAWRADPPRLTRDRGEKGEAPTKLDFVFSDKDDVKEGGQAYRIYLDGRHVATAYYATAVPEGEAAWLRMPNREPAPARTGFVHAYREAKLLRMLPTRYFLYVGCVLGVLGLLVPGLLIPFYDFWMRYVTAPLGWFNTRAILTVVWVVIFTPMAIARRLLSRDSLRRREVPPGDTYWLEKNTRDHKHFTRGF